MTDYSGIEILSHEEFWAKDPAPGTVFFELGQDGLETVGREIDPEVDHPDNAVMVRVGSDEPGADELYAVLKWGSWATPENQKIRTLRDEAAKLMAEEDARIAAEDEEDDHS